MCHFILTILPQEANTEAVEKIYVGHGRNFKPSTPDERILSWMQKEERCYLTSAGTCDCGTALLAQDCDYYSRKNSDDALMRQAEKLKKDAKLLEEAGCFGLVLEKIPALLAKEVSQSLQIPTIGIGAGKYCDGQVLVMHDLLGINTEFKPRFLRRYLDLHQQITQATQQYIHDVKARDFPNDNEQY